MTKKRAGILVLKVGILAAMLTYLFGKSAIDFDRVGAALLDPWSLAANAVLLSIILVFISARWSVLARAQNISLSVGRSIQVQMISSFFSMFLSGSVAADVVKACYVALDNPARKTGAAVSVVADRVMSCFTLLVFGGAVFLLSPQLVSAKPELVLLQRVVLAGVLISCVGLLAFLLVLPRRRLALLHAWSARVPALGGIASALESYQGAPRALLAAFGLSLGSLLTSVALYYIQGRILGVSLPFTAYLFLVPASILVNYLAFVPFGIGVGQVAFFHLFTLMGGDAREGATLCTVFQAYLVLFHLAGAVLFVRDRKPPQQADVGKQLRAG